MSDLAREILKTYYTAEDYFALPNGVRAELIGGVLRRDIRRYGGRL